ncbi:SNARE associated Golgi protein-related protein [Cellulomonas flavigena DSM 20109]|uniref:SNARE associated Golgi protein-related protein n=1 Tax=Cellulomonas flavigena (strain ATCC 482 / DSM 20109 / BCRC 11376 / JCM 18109 / NBRC 3775 / NCIMB 8073 / NRS 134) TaxID=446466 RepID=D5UKJ3_CELFN|nr:VTT domain-containing protein [Cellulomonas flavigena]ADG75854.1 SNARE associated Golgi protein-related protein [Cellulomonas flavigena DSM 20109]
MLTTTVLTAALTDAPHALLAGGPLPALGPDFLNAENLIESFGTAALIGIVAVVFIETGLLFPFLPGDSLLFTAGALVAQDSLQLNIWVLCLLLFVAAFVGDQVAYAIGRKLGPKVFNRPDSRFFKQKYIDQTYAYFDKYGGRTIIVARFVPFVRTYAPVAAGVGKMSYRHFVSFNVIGALLWGVGVTLLGYWLGNFPFIKNNIEALLVLIVGVSVVPVFVELWRARRKERTGETVEGRDTDYDEPVERAAVEREVFGRATTTPVAGQAGTEVVEDPSDAGTARPER